MSELKIEEFDPNLCLPPDDNRSVARSHNSIMTASVLKLGQLVAALLCPHPEYPGKFLILDGTQRRNSCRELGIPLKAILLPAPVPKPEQIKLRLLHNNIRQNMKQHEIADDIAEFMRHTECSQEEAAIELGLTTAAASRALGAKRRIPAELKPMAELVSPSVTSLIATLWKSDASHTDAMRQSFDYAITPGRTGKRPTRDQVAVYIKQFKKPTSRGAKAKTLGGTVEGRKIELAVLPDDSTESLIKFLQSLATKLSKYRDLPPDSLGFLFNA